MGAAELATAVAAGAYGRLAARLQARAAAHLAALMLIELHRLLNAEDGLFELDYHLGLDVRATVCTRTSPAASPTPEKAIEDAEPKRIETAPEVRIHAS